MTHPPPLPKPSGGVPIIGQKRFDEDITFELAKFSFHPPSKFDNMYVMMMALLTAGSPNIYKLIHTFGGQFSAYLAEDCELGPKHLLVMVTANEEGQLGFIVPRPVGDDPERRKQAH